MKLVDAMNTFAMALFMIKDKGYKIGIMLENNRITSYRALKDGNEIIGINPLALLGLINIAEEYGDKWNKIRTGNFYNKIIEIEVENIKTVLGYEPEFEYNKIIINNIKELEKIIVAKEIKWGKK
jgi:hypothetical protein